MTDQYRKLNEDELRSVYNQLAGHYTAPTGLKREIEAHVRKYYPDTVCSASLTVNSAYNDQTYDNTAGALVVYNKEGVEIVPLPETARESRGLWSSFEVPDETSEQIEGDIVVHLATQPLPALYIKKP